MSLAATLRPGRISFNRQSQSDANQTIPLQHETNYLNLHRTLLRFQHLILLTPAPSTEPSSDLSPLQKQTQAELWSPLPYGRNKWLQDIEGARTLLLQLERQAQGIRVARRKHEAVKELAEKRAIIKRLKNRVEEIGHEVDSIGEEHSLPSYGDDPGESLYDVLQQQRRSQNRPAVEHGDVDIEPENGRITSQVEKESLDEKGQLPNSSKQEDLFSPGEVRQRGRKSKSSKQESSAETSGFSSLPSTERSLLDSARVHEDITASLVSMAAQLKQQSNAMAFALDQDKGLVGRALEGLDISVSGMEAASKNMAFLRRMGEEQGWFGRLKLYGMIFAMWVAAILLVFVCPKLRF
ncbi:hypothetical protein PV10_00920 [Exophiala mesophila]|uniref:t-SNARE coiled-coil homology domain-containing protein n=1 Tax=Exophiala mesophila TaxID=212818 RepID=A0A0D1ZRA1_EXOME|nr:uncharacterized protein PV10_00920 [Exophiala mesophila]KIV97132.1 hypothetical protein PV10_00920 [Exophiala mesophila]